MKNILFLFLLSFSFCFKFLYLPINETIEFGSSDSEGQFFVDLNDFAKYNNVTIRLEVYGGNIDKSIQYNFSDDKSVSSFQKADNYYVENKNGEIDLEYRFEIKERKKYLIMKYTNFNGNKLKIKVVSDERYETLKGYIPYVLAILGICCCGCCIGGCFACYHCCFKNKNKQNYPGEIVPINEENNAQNSEYIPPPSS